MCCYKAKDQFFFLPELIQWKQLHDVLRGSGGVCQAWESNLRDVIRVISSETRDLEYLTENQCY